jgi:two-component system, sensor histidine kinase
MPLSLHNRALIFAAHAGDAALSEELLLREGINAKGFLSLDDIVAAVKEGAGCLVLVEEVLTDISLPVLRYALRLRPSWADLPLVVIATEVGQLRVQVSEAFPESGNVTLLERPLNPHIFVSAVRVCLRASAHQRQVAQLLEERERAVRMRDEFLAMLAHELRNPLAPMRNAVFILNQIDVQDPMLLRMRDILDRQLFHITRMVDDLLDVARLERGKVELQKSRVDFSAVVTAAVESCQPAAKAKGHSICLQLSGSDLPVEADPVRLEQVVSNLINNAAKYSPKPGVIRVQTARDDGHALVSVSDDGMGFEPGTGESLFTLFAQAQPTLDRAAGGLGIGLTIARRLVELHGGSVSASSPGPNRGATFVVRLPLTGVDMASAASLPVPTTEVPSRRIVVVDDNQDIRETLRVLLSMWGHQVETAEDGRSGLDCILRNSPDVAVVDIGLPGMNGYDVARAVRKEDPERRIRLIALTGYGQPAEKEKALAAGFDVHLLKPIAPAMLADVLAGS